MKIGARIDKATAALQAWLSSIETGTRVPSERKLATQLGQTHYAVNRAVACLISEGVLRRKGYRLYYIKTVRPSREDMALPFACVAARNSPNLEPLRNCAMAMGIELQESAWESVDEACFLLKKLRPAEIQGVLFDAPFSEQVMKWRAEIKRLTAHKIPCVCLGQPVLEAAALFPDYRAALAQTIRFLMKEGHRELALISPEEQAPSVLECHEGWEGECHRNGLETSRARVFTAQHSLLHQGAAEVARLFMGSWKNVTAVIAHERAIAPMLAEELARRGLPVPGKVSIVALGDSADLKKATPPISSASFDPDEEFYAEMALRMLTWIATQKTTEGKLPPLPHLRMEPRLILRGSTLPNPQGQGGAPALAVEGTAPARPAAWPEDPGARRRMIEAISRKPYPLTAGLQDFHFHPVNLRPFANRHLNFRRGWLGDLPLRNLSAGEQRLHGVLFDILKGGGRSDFETVVFRSLKNAVGNGRRLPSEIELPVGRRAKAVYFLHGCGYSGFLQTFARYRFYARSGLIGEVPLVSLGRIPHGCDAEEHARAIRQANIQDWWPDYEQTDFEHSRRVIVAQDEEQMQSYRYLYTLEWINPLPEMELRCIKISVLPNQPITLGLLAISIFS